MRARESTSPSEAAEAEAESRAVRLPGSPLESVTVAVRRHRRARHVRLHVDELGQVTASVPQRFAANRLDEIVRARAGWLENALLRMDEASRAAEVDLVRGDPVRLMKEWKPIFFIVEAMKRFEQSR
jgi:predicted metal-dependent hydrolase